MLRLPKIVTGAVAGAALLMFGVISAYPQAAPRGATPPSAETARQIELLGKILDILRSDYVDKPDDSKLITAAINGVLGSLDPHSSYMDAKSYRDMQQTTSGQFGGLGMQVNGGRRSQSGVPDRRHACRSGRHSGRRRDHPRR